MALEENVRNQLLTYVKAHIGDESWHCNYFNFIDDADLARRLGEEFISTRYIYKMLEGLKADSWLLRAQIRLQVMAYASIYEASIHHLLFNKLADNPEVLKLTQSIRRKSISIPPNQLTMLQNSLVHDGRKIIPTYEVNETKDERFVRFDQKAECAKKLGIINEKLKDELVEFYEARNSIHIHAEIRKGLEYELNLSRRCYLRLRPFKNQVVLWCGRTNV